MTPRVHALWAALASLVVAFAVVWGFFLVGSPMLRRLERLDERRLRELQAIASEIDSLVKPLNEQRMPKEPLPQTLDDVARKARRQRLSPSDPETGEPYEYTVTGESTYELCATFARPRDSDSNVFWNHPAGRHCFAIDVRDPPPYYY